MIRRAEHMIRGDAFFLEPIPIRQIVFYTCSVYILLHATAGNSFRCITPHIYMPETRLQVIPM